MTSTTLVIGIMKLTPMKMLPLFENCCSKTLGVFRGSICPLDSATNQDDHPVVSGPVAFWIFIYHLSKYYELVDTMLIVFKRKPLILLHVYHHLIMIWITWSWMKDPWLVGSWWCVMVNVSVSPSLQNIRDADISSMIS